MGERVGVYLKEWGFTNLSVYSFSTLGSLSSGKKYEREISVFVEREGEFLFAMTCFEYSDLLYIEKIDSTKSAEKCLYSSIVLAVVKCFNKRIHVFARAQPQLLFPESSNNPQKKILTERNLVRWWARTLSGATVKKGWYYVPGESSSSTKDIFTLLSSSSNGLNGADGSNGSNGTCKNETWEFGWPWKEDQGVQVVPIFPDDPKYKCLLLLDEKSTIKDFANMLQVTGECGSGRFSGFFILDPNPASTSSSFTDVSNEEYINFYKKLMYLDFSDAEKSKKSCQVLIELLKQMNITPRQIFKENVEATPLNFLEKKRVVEPVVLASNLIKRKKL